MSITTGKMVSIEYTLTLDNGDVADTNVGGDPLAFECGAGQIIPGLEKELEGLAEGDMKQVTVVPEEAYGAYVDEAVMDVPKSNVPEEGLSVGAYLQAQGEDGQILNGVITEIGDENVIIDFNHPLAGKTLTFDVKVLGVE
ncbi:MAG: peptidylprolyl isomerase [Gammaproteobacteria bacterium]|nr:MAG: peptidylprolyl isomerase [Gammaproteobacteria bacterium]